MLLLGFYNTPVVDYDPCLFAFLAPGDHKQPATVRDTREPYVCGVSQGAGLLARYGEVLPGDRELVEFGCVSALGHDSFLFGSLTVPASVQCVGVPGKNGRDLV